MEFRYGSSQHFCLLLLVAAALALIASNTPGLLQLYDNLLSLKLSVQLGTLGLTKPLLLWINEGLMAIFCFLVGLEFKREAIEGHLSSSPVTQGDSADACGAR